MDNYVLISDSSCDLSSELLNKYNIDLVPYYVSFDSVNYFKENIDISTEEFYKKIEDSRNFPKTSLPPIQDYIDIFKKHLELGKDIVCICLSSMFSGSYQSANNAKNILLEDFPDRRIEVIDSRQATAGQGLVVYSAALIKESGANIDSLIEKIDIIKQTAKINFTVDSLEHLQKGGRIGKASALAGALLNIKPIIIMYQGELSPVAKVRGKKKAIKEIVDMTLKEIENFDDYYISILSATRKDDCQMLKDEFLLQAPKAIIHISSTIGVTIGTHAGPTAIGIAYIKKYDRI